MTLLNLKLIKITNKSNCKETYSCMSNIKVLIQKHNLKYFKIKDYEENSFATVEKNVPLKTNVWSKTSYIKQQSARPKNYFGPACGFLKK